MGTTDRLEASWYNAAEGPAFNIKVGTAEVVVTQSGFASARPDIHRIEVDPHGSDVPGLVAAWLAVVLPGAWANHHLEAWVRTTIILVADQATAWVGVAQPE